MQNKEVALKAPLFSQSLRFSCCLGGDSRSDSLITFSHQKFSSDQWMEWLQSWSRLPCRPETVCWTMSYFRAAGLHLSVGLYLLQQCFSLKKKVQQENNGLFLLGRERVATDWRESQKFSCWHRGYRIAILKFLLGELGIYIRRFRSILKWTLGLHMRVFWRSAFIASGPKQNSLCYIFEEDIYGRALALKCQMVLIVSHAEEGSALNITHIISVSCWKWNRLEQYLLWP